MPINQTIEHDSLSLLNSPQKSYTLSAHLSTQYETNNTMVEKNSTKRTIESLRKTPGSAQKTPSSTFATFQSSRRQANNDPHPTMRGRSNTDVQQVTSASNNLKQQQLNIGGSGSDRTVHLHNYQRCQSPPIPPKPKCTLPITNCQPGYVTPSKLFNMMGYGLENQYLFMLAHYLYIIDCRTKEKFNENHIITGNSYFIIYIFEEKYQI